MDPVQTSAGAVGSGRCGGRVSVCADSPVSGHLRRVFRVLQQSKKMEAEEKEEGCSDLGT